jgi:RecA-family ATPase
MPSDIHSKSKGRLLNISDLKDYKPPPARHLIHGGLLNVGSRFIIFGDEGTYKSALAVHAGFSLARESQWLKFGTSQCNILYVQGEMSMAQTKERIDQYCAGSKQIYLARPSNVPNEEERAEKYAYPPNFITETLTQDISLDTPNGYQFLRGELEMMVTELPEHPIVLIADPLFKLYRYDLVKEEDMKALTTNLDRLIKDTTLFSHHPGMAVVICHHTRKSQVDKEGNTIQAPGSMEMFGSAHLKWWADTIIRTSLDDNDETDSTIHVTFTKHRLAKYPPPKRIDLYWDRDTFHPYITNVIKPKRPEDIREFRGMELGLLE